VTKPRPQQDLPKLRRFAWRYVPSGSAVRARSFKF
jgi:hypothetical protein